MFVKKLEIKIFFCALILLLSSCSIERPKGKTEAEILYKEAKELMDDGRYILATEKLNSIRSQYPYSYYATHAELLLADILFKQENYVESASAYQLFKDFHPKHQRLRYVLWRVAQSYFNQRPSTFDRDLTPVKQAIKYYSELLARFPNSDYAKEAIKKVRDAQKMIENKQKYIADFYYKTHVYDSAHFRYKDILNNFQQKALREHAILGMIKSSYKLKKKEQCLNDYNSFYHELSKDPLNEGKDIIKKCKKL